MPKQPRFDRRSGTPGKKPSAPSLRSGRAGCFGGPSRMGERNRSRSGLVILIVETLLKFLPSPGQPRAFRYGVTVVLVAVFFLFSLGAKVAAGPFGFLFLILRLSSKKIMKRLLAGYKAHLERTYTKPTFSGPMADLLRVRCNWVKQDADVTASTGPMETISDAGRTRRGDCRHGRPYSILANTS
jgi:hypothetical protein